MICYLDIRPSDNPPYKKLHSSMRVWVQFPGSSNIRVYEFRLEFLSYIQKKKKVSMIYSSEYIYSSHISHTLDIISRNL
jgi:hypothetical protein